MASQTCSSLKIEKFEMSINNPFLNTPSMLKLSRCIGWEIDTCHDAICKMNLKSARQ